MEKMIKLIVWIWAWGMTLGSSFAQINGCQTIHRMNDSTFECFSCRYESSISIRIISSTRFEYVQFSNGIAFVDAGDLVQKINGEFMLRSNLSKRISLMEKTDFGTSLVIPVDILSCQKLVHDGHELFYFEELDSIGSDYCYKSRNRVPSMIQKIYPNSIGSHFGLNGFKLARSLWPMDPLREMLICPSKGFVRTITINSDGTFNLVIIFGDHFVSYKNVLNSNLSENEIISQGEIIGLPTTTTQMNFLWFVIRKSLFD